MMNKNKNNFKFRDNVKIVNAEGLSIYATSSKVQTFLQQNRNDVNSLKIRNFKHFAKFSKFNSDMLNSRISPRINASGDKTCTRKEQKNYEKAIKHLRFLGFVSF